jgi:hypothetical protein
LHIGVEVIVFTLTCQFNSLLHIGVEVIVFTLTCQFNSLLHAGVEAIDEAHKGEWDISDQGPAPSEDGRLVGEESGGMGLAMWRVGVQAI